MELEAPAADWMKGNLEPSGQGSPPGASEPPPVEPAPGPAKGPAVRTSYYETFVRPLEPPSENLPGLPLQLTLVEDKHLFITLGGVELAPEDVSVTTPGDYLKVDLHLGSDACRLNGNLYRSGSLKFGESGIGFEGLIYETCDGDTTLRRITGMPIPRPELNLDDLLTMQDGSDGRTALSGQASVLVKVRERFLERLKASPAIQPVFFPQVHSTVRVPDEAWVQSIAIALICTAVGELGIRNFRQLVDTKKATDYLDTQFRQAAAMACGKALYDEAFDECALSSKGVHFSSYLREREKWASELATCVKGQAFLIIAGARFEAGDTLDTNKTLNRALYLLKRLGVSGPELETVRERFKAFPLWTEDTPDESLCLKRSDFPNTIFSSEVIAAATQERTLDTSNPWGDGSVCTWVEYYGEPLVGFLNSQAGAFRTAVKADNEDHKNTYSGASCFITGTLIQLADGRQEPIESLAPDAQLLAADGSTTLNQAEELVFPCASHDALYGINEIPPFFTGGHMILTTGGWRAMDPETPRMESPGIDVEQLQIGDKVIRLVSVDPFRIEEMEIRNLTRRMLNSESRVYGLRVEGTPSYFANGIAVSANYPTLTEARIVQGLQSLSESERAALLKTLEPVMPLFFEVMRDIAGPRLAQALGVSVEETAP